jgi:glycosyltransferase involved in cell wall biosynthesis
MDKLIRITTIPGSLRSLLKGQLGYMNNFYEVIAVSSPGDILKQVGRDEGVRYEEVEMTRVISPLKDILSLYKLIVLFKKEKPFIVHTHTPKAGTLGMIAAKLTGVPHRLHTVAGLPLLETTGNKRKVLDMVEKFTYKCATKVYPNSKGLYDIIIKNGYTNKTKLKVIGNGSSNGIDTSFFDPQIFDADKKKDIRQKIGISPNDFVFIYVGRIVKAKGVNELIQAFKKINSKYDNAKLLILGSYERELDPVLHETEKEIESNPQIFYMGYQNDVRPFFSIANVLTFPSYREGFPNVVLQASAMNLNSIVSDINGCNEIIKNNETGFVIPPKNAEMLYKKMEYLCLNPGENERMGNNARASICENFERAFIWNAILNEYKALK